MSLDTYLNMKRRNQVKKQLRRTKPYLMGQKLDLEVDRVLGISDSEKMDWAAIAKPTISSDYPTPKSIGEKEIREVAEYFKIRPYKLHWFYLQKTTKIRAGGRDKSDYMEVLKACAMTAVTKELSDEEKKIGIILFANSTGVTITQSQADSMLFKGEL